MSYKPDEKDWMAYLYGELDGDEKHRFDEYLRQHPEAGHQLEGYQRLRALLSMAEDQEVIAPPIFVGQPPEGAKGSAAFLNSSAFRAIAAVAASIILIIMAGRLAGARLTVSDEEVKLTFGDAPQQHQQLEKPAALSISPEQVQDMINASLEKNNAVVNQSLAKTQEDLEKSLRTHLSLNSGNMDRLVREVSNASQEELRKYVESIRVENMEQVKEYFQLTSIEQRQYIENLLVDYSKYLQQQRNNDLQLVQTRMNSIEQNTDLFKQETEQVLSTIMTTVGTTAKGETQY